MSEALDNINRWIFWDKAKMVSAPVLAVGSLAVEFTYDTRGFVGAAGLLGAFILYREGSDGLGLGKEIKEIYERHEGIS